MCEQEWLWYRFPLPCRHTAEAALQLRQNVVCELDRQMGRPASPNDLSVVGGHEAIFEFSVRVR